jgi:flagellar protein FliL
MVIEAFRSNSGKLPLKVIIAVLLVVVAGGGAFTFSKAAKKSPGKKEAAEKVELTQMKLEEFVVNLRDTSESRYLKVNMVLAVEGAAEAGGHGEGGSPDEAKIRDAVITVLTKKTYSDLQSVQGKADLKEELKSALNYVLEGTKVHDIYFTSFAMQ